MERLEGTQLGFSACYVLHESSFGWEQVLRLGGCTKLDLGLHTQPLVSHIGTCMPELRLLDLSLVSTKKDRLLDVT